MDANRNHEWTRNRIRDRRKGRTGGEAPRGALGSGPAAAHGVNLSGRGTPDREGASGSRRIRRSLWSYGHLWLRSAKLDPRALPRRSRPTVYYRFC
jgi:hypothetical protein